MPKATRTGNWSRVSVHGSSPLAECSLMRGMMTVVPMRSLRPVRMVQISTFFLTAVTMSRVPLQSPRVAPLLLAKELRPFEPLHVG